MVSNFCQQVNYQMLTGEKSIHMEQAPILVSQGSESYFSPPSLIPIYFTSFGGGRESLNLEAHD